MKARVILTALLVFAGATLSSLWRPVSTIVAGQIAGQQLSPSDASYVISQVGNNLLGGWSTVLLVAMLTGLYFIWRKPLKEAWKAIAAITVIAGAVLMPQPSQAYYDKSDYAEPYFIMPNESAFWVPDVGDNKNSQVAFGSEAYFQQNKIAAKRFIIPHTKLEGSGLWSNYYVPAGRLIIVDRTPYAREWVGSADRGSSRRNEAFPCQSKEGMNITVGIAIGVSVLEDNAAKFLYRFGAEPPKGDRTDPVVVFTSVLHSRSLTTIMDSVGRNKVQSLVCNEIGSRTFDQANAQATDIMNAVKKNAETYFATVGITLDYLGWADTMTFDKSVQKAVNDAYIAGKVGPVMGILTQNAENRVKEGLGIGLAQHGLPSSLVVLPQGMDLTKAFSGTK